MGMGPQEIAVGSHFAGPAAAPTVIDPALMQTPEGPALIQTPRRNHAIVLLTLQAELRTVAPAATPSRLVLEGPVSRLKKDRDWTIPRPEKTGPAVRSFG